MPAIHLIDNGQLIEAINELSAIATKYPSEDFSERLEALRMEFNMMQEYFSKGINDPKRGEMYRIMKGKLQNLDYDIQVRNDLMEMPMIKPWLKSVSQMDSTFDALLHADMEHAFYAVLTSYHWRNENIDDWVHAYTSADGSYSTAHYVLLSALTISAMQHFSKQKALCLARIFNLCKDEVMRQRAFVGCILSLSMDRDMVYNKKRSEVLDCLFSNPDAIKSLIEFQMQLIKCTQADTDATKINETLMPEIMKNQPFIITRNGIEERDEDNDPNSKDDSYEDAENRIEAMEQNIRKVQQMHRQGSDIFFGGFKQMKRYPFFYKTSNWFAPFDIKHPDLSTVMEKLKNSKFLERVLEKGPFCNSDKYSFVFALSDVIGTFSEKVRNLLEEGEMGPIGMHDDIAELQDPAYLRRQYLQDLFRFYSINPLGQTLSNPFKDAEDFEAWLISLSYIDSTHLMEIGRYLIKKKYYRGLEDIINCYPDQDCVDLDFLSGELLLSEQVYGEAVDYYNSYLQEHPNHQPSLRGMAKAYYSSGDYGKASFYYDALRTLDPERISYALNYSMAMVKDGKADEVLNELYRLNFEHPDNHAISNTLGWALLYAEKPEKALSIYEKMPSDVISHDLSIYLNYVYANFVTRFRMPELKFQRNDSNQPTCQMLLEEMRADNAMLAIYGIGEAEISIMAHSL